MTFLKTTRNISNKNDVTFHIFRREENKYQDIMNNHYVSKGIIAREEKLLLKIVFANAIHIPAVFIELEIMKDEPDCER